MGSESDRPVMEKACAELDDARALVRDPRHLGAPQPQGGRGLRRERGGARHPRAHLRRGHGGGAARRRRRVHRAAGDRRADRVGRPRRHGRAARDLADAARACPSAAWRSAVRATPRSSPRASSRRAARRSRTGNERVRHARGGGARDRAGGRARRGLPARRRTTCPAAGMLSAEERAVYRVPLPRQGDGPRGHDRARRGRGAAALALALPSALVPVHRRLGPRGGRRGRGARGGARRQPRRRRRRWPRRSRTWPGAGSPS